MKVLVIRDREAGNIIEQVSSMEEGMELIQEFEEKDKAEGTFEEGFYEIAEVDENECFWSKEVAILMGDNCTADEAKKHLANGTVIYKESDMADYLFNYVNCGNEAEEAMEAWENLAKVEYAGEKYRIEYVL